MDNIEDVKLAFQVIIVKDGPYIVKGGLPMIKESIVFDDEYVPIKWVWVENYPQKDTYSLCRCGKTKQRPYCDGSHVAAGFKGTETASREPYSQQARKLTGRGMYLYDARKLCMGVGFCHRAGSVWLLTRHSDDPEKRRIAMEECWDCPSGRLVAADKEGNPIEKRFNPVISLMEDPRDHTFNPLWLKGNVPVISSDSTTYEIRNRVTLCACGRSDNKPFCDGKHYFA